MKILKIWKIWLSDQPEPEHFKKFTETWVKIKDGEVIEVNYDTLKSILPSLKVEKLREHFAWNNTVINHYIRYQLMYYYGGIYLDLDVEVLKDSNIWKSKEPAFFMETEIPIWVNNHVMVCNEKGHSIYDRLASMTYTMGFGKPNKIEINTGPGLVTEITNDTYFLNKIKIYDPEYTTPWNWNEKPDRTRITENTIAVHHFSHSWKK